MRAEDLSTELYFKTSRSGGKGGQHVNKVETRVELYFNIAASRLLTGEEKARLFSRLKHKINDRGELRMSYSRERSQLANKKKLILMFYELIEKSLAVNKKRIPTKKPRAVDEKRLKDKRKRSEIKKNRQLPY
jgi:ribosome-associated protein